MEHKLSIKIRKLRTSKNFLRAILAVQVITSFNARKFAVVCSPGGRCVGKTLRLAQLQVECMQKLVEVYKNV